MDTFVEVSICGRPCEVVRDQEEILHCFFGLEVDGAYDWLECIVPNVGITESMFREVIL